MKTRKTKQETAATRGNSKVKLENLKLHKETLQNLSDLSPSDQHAAAVKGGITAVVCSRNAGMC